MIFERCRSPAPGAISASTRSETSVNPTRSPLRMPPWPATPPPAPRGRPSSALGTKPQTRRNIDDQPQRQGPLFDEAADVRSPLPRGDVPVEVSHLVARFVRPKLREHQAHARPRRMIRAREDRQRARAARESANGRHAGRSRRDPPRRGRIGSVGFRRNGQIIGVLASNRRRGNKPRSTGSDMLRAAAPATPADRRFPVPIRIARHDPVRDHGRTLIDALETPLALAHRRDGKAPEPCRNRPVEPHREIEPLVR